MLPILIILYYYYLIVYTIFWNGTWEPGIRRMHLKTTPHVELTEDGDINIIGSSVKKADSIDLES
jgi:hypothetical protein